MTTRTIVMAKVAWKLLHAFAHTILHIVTAYLRHPFHRFAVPLPRRGRLLYLLRSATDECGVYLITTIFLFYARSMVRCSSSALTVAVPSFLTAMPLA